MSRRRALYSRSNKPRVSGSPSVTGLPDVAPIYIDVPEEDGPSVWQRAGAWWTPIYQRHQGKLLIGTGALIALLIVGLYDVTRPAIPRVNDDDFIAAVNTVVDHRKPGPSVSALSYAKVIPSVVQVQGYEHDKPKSPDATDLGKPWLQPGYDQFETVGTGVVIDDQGDILTNFHVAGSAPKLHVSFSDGTEATGRIVSADRPHDLAVVRTDIIPDDLQPATLASTGGLNPGDEVTAIGFPFGIGPSASSGVISGLHRTFLNPEGKQTLTDMIQFDAAANPGNSGGPLIDQNGEVLGSVTALMNPSGSRTFAGIGFATPIETAAGAVGDNPL